MTDVWFFGRDGNTYGPFSADQLKEQVSHGRLHPQDSVWKEGMTKRVVAAKVQHLFTAAQLSPPEVAATPGPSVPAESMVPAAPPDQTTADTGPTDIPTEFNLVPLYGEAPPESAAAEAAKPNKQQEVRKRRVISMKGGIVLSQDGAIVRFKKKCGKCNHEDTSLTTLQIPSGTARLNYYCPKCRKNHPIEIQGV